MCPESSPVAVENNQSEHMDENEDSYVNNTDKNLYCEICDTPSTFQRNSSLKQHHASHNGRSWPCEVCSKVYMTKVGLKRHKETMIQENINVTHVTSPFHTYTYWRNMHVAILVKSPFIVTFVNIHSLDDVIGNFT